MPDSILTLPQANWPYSQSLMRRALGLALGLLIGLERERRGKEAGVRTFGFIGLLGAIGGALGMPYALAALALTGLLAVLLNLSSLRANQGTELTTSAAMMVTAMSGILCGQGHTLPPAAVMVIGAALLAWKERLADFSMGLSEGEIRSALLLAILAIVIYPALPTGTVGPGDVIEPRYAWVTVILIAGIGFFNYVLWKIYGTRGTELSGFFGGLINSNFTVIELSERVREVGAAFVPTAYRGILLATTAMVARNATLLLILAPQALVGALSAFALMALTNVALVLGSMRQRHGARAEATPEINLELPFSLAQALKYGAIFLVLHVVGALTQRHFGDTGFYFVSVVGGLLSSASAVAAAATLAEQGNIAPITAGVGAVLASFTSLVFSLSFVLRTRSGPLIRTLAVSMGAVGAAGLVGLLASHWAEPWVMPVVDFARKAQP
ncbi:MAG: MgtC/SapB family protein [Proteobacteria bacterium]|nr:MgtC/SapB family protein [Pseudomonadota bacterium]